MRISIFVLVLILSTQLNGQNTKPKNNMVTPQDFGFVSNNYSPKVFSNDATDYIQACLDSPYHVFIPAGYYYITRPLKVYNSKSIMMVGNYSRDRKKYRKDDIYLKDKTVIYTDKDIDFWHIYESDIEFSNGTMLVSKVKQPKQKSIFKFFYKDNLVQNCRIDRVALIGSEDELKGFGNGYIGISFDETTDNPQSKVPGRKDNGELHYLKVDVKARFLHTVYLQNTKKSNSRNIINVEGFANKRAVVLNYGGGCKITGWNHTRYILTGQEKNYASITLNSGANDLDFTHIEVTGAEPKKGYYPNRIAYENNAKNNWLIGGGRNFWNIMNDWMIIGKEKFMNIEQYKRLYKDGK